ncbi:TetR/AcrR family transcriptional regulator [Fodinicola feengrottensis]|uniref:TetR/AcrR family transcriptional regulator n=1 Tax=Fodinicola feengrottensis TaxID=435914 RepID=A0ABN2I642_9ACTN|nr:TetR/AcrR family transcriptional regulator [Fodinicola feengrottensis]
MAGAVGRKAGGGTGAAVDGRRSRWDNHRAQRRAEFVEVATSAVEEYGPSTSTAQIADLAGVARPILYRHFKDKDDLHRAIAQRAVAMLVEQLTGRLSEVGSARELITQTVDTYLQFLEKHPHLYRFVVQYAAFTRTGADVVADVKGALAAHVGTLFHRFLQRSGKDDVLVDAMAFGVIGFVESVGNWWLENRSAMDRAPVSEMLCGSILRSIRGALKDRGLDLDPDEPLPWLQE